MIQLFQEAIPFSNQRIDSPVSSDGTYLNPVIMPFAINTTLGSNVFETVAYIRNTSIENFYSDIVVCLMKEDSNVSNSQLAQGTLSFDNSTSAVTFGVNDYTGIGCSVGFPYQGSQSAVKKLDGKYKSNYVPITDATDSRVRVKFSYGYDEVSALEWEDLSSILVIPYIGNQTTPDTSYIPIRIRIEFKETPSVFTIRDYFIDVSYATTGGVN